MDVLPGTHVLRALCGFLIAKGNKLKRRIRAIALRLARQLEQHRNPAGVVIGTRRVGHAIVMRANHPAFPDPWTNSDDVKEPSTLNFKILSHGMISRHPKLVFHIGTRFLETLA